MIMAVVAALMMGSTVMAQDDNQKTKREGRQFDQTEMAQKRTEQMVKKYGLSKEQADKLLELNKKYTPQMRFGRGARGGNRSAQGVNDESAATKRQQPTEEQKARMESRRKEMQEQMQAYEAELKSILTPDQYTGYLTDKQARMQRGNNQNRNAERNK